MCICGQSWPGVGECRHPRWLSRGRCTHGGYLPAAEDAHRTSVTVNPWVPVLAVPREAAGPVWSHPRHLRHPRHRQRSPKDDDGVHTAPRCQQVSSQRRNASSHRTQLRHGSAGFGGSHAEVGLGLTPAPPCTRSATDPSQSRRVRRSSSQCPTRAGTVSSTLSAMTRVRAEHLPAGRAWPISCVLAAELTCAQAFCSQLKAFLQSDVETQQNRHHLCLPRGRGPHDSKEGISQRRQSSENTQLITIISEL